MITAIGQIMLYVNNPQETAIFWQEKMGFIERNRIEQDDFVLIDLLPSVQAETSIVLMEKAFIAKMQPELELGMPSLMFTTNTIDALYAKCLATNVTVGALVERDGKKNFNFSDSEGNYYAVTE